MWTDEQTAFDLWLKRGLAQDYGNILREPLPDELLRLLNAPPSER